VSIYSNAFSKCAILFEVSKEKKKVEIETGSRFTIEIISDICRDDWIQENSGVTITP
jgi:hypothetical protein